MRTRFGAIFLTSKFRVDVNCNFIQNAEANVSEKAASASKQSDEDQELNLPPKKKARTFARSAKTKTEAVSNFNGSRIIL